MVCITEMEAVQKVGVCLLFCFIVQSYSINSQNEIEVIRNTKHNGRDGKTESVDNFMKELYGRFVQTLPIFTSHQLSNLSKTTFDVLQTYTDALDVPLRKLEAEAQFLIDWTQKYHELEQFIDMVIKFSLDTNEIKRNGSIETVNEFLEELYGRFLQTTPYFTAEQLLEFNKRAYDNIRQTNEVVQQQMKLEGKAQNLFNWSKKYTGLKRLVDSIGKHTIGISNEQMFGEYSSYCGDLYRLQGGVHYISPDNGKPFPVFCDMDTDGGNWTVIQRRQDGSVNFQKNWQEYKEGFGDIEGEFWLGNDKIHRLTSSGNFELRVDIKDWDGNMWYAVYEDFIVGDENSNYLLTVGKYNGTAGDSMGYHNGMEFSTIDRDNDKNSGEACSKQYGGNGGWWYHSCDKANINGLYPKDSGDNGIEWQAASSHSMMFARMMVRRY